MELMGKHGMQFSSKEGGSCCSHCIGQFKAVEYTVTTAEVVVPNTAGQESLRNFYSAT